MIATDQELRIACETFVGMLGLSQGAILTGSHAYGTPTEESDVDLCVLLPKEVCAMLWQKREQGRSGIYFGKMNLIVFHQPEKFAAWKKVTEGLVARKPVSRDVAVAAFQAAGFDGLAYGEDGA